MPVSFFIRIMSFMLVVFVGLVLCFVATWAFTLEVPDLIVSSLGALMFFIFASQEDVLVAWRIMRPKPRSTVSGASGGDTHDTYAAHTRPPLSPASSIGVPLGKSQVSSKFDLPIGPKQVHRLTMQDDSIELSSTKSKPLQAVAVGVGAAVRDIDEAMAVGRH
ncbi:hypothetical protein FRC12_018838 [Ceratobasidium sp. 428]|nr:hypothetical protein FRC12_018838 [Ceratobasidium sp. 428]